MAALTAERSTIKQPVDAVLANTVVLPVAAGKKIFKGGLVVLSAGYAQPGATAAALVAVGRAEQTVDNTAGANGALTVRVRRGCFKWVNAGADLVVAADLFATCYVTDDQTVSHTSTGKSAAGKVIQIDSDGVWVETY